MKMILTALSNMVTVPIAARSGPCVNTIENRGESDDHADGAKS